MKILRNEEKVDGSEFYFHQMVIYLLLNYVYVHIVICQTLFLIVALVGMPTVLYLVDM